MIYSFLREFRGKLPHLLRTNPQVCLQFMCDSLCSVLRTACSTATILNSDGGTLFDVRVEEGKLYYEGKWFHKGQQVYVESREHGQER